jgi:hypothetical protein
MKKIVLTVLAFTVSGCANIKYPGWQNVEVVSQLPNKKCAYKTKETCTESNEACYDWYKKRATKFGANTVVMHGSDDNPNLADYYFCNGEKDIIKTRFNEKDFAPYFVKGTATVKGQAFLKTMGGDVKYAAGDEIRLFPAVDYTREIVEYSKIGGADNIDETWLKYVRKDVAGGFGNFEFNNLPPGDYFLETAIFWEVPGRYGLIKSGGIIKKQIKVLNGETVTVILTE